MFEKLSDKLSAAFAKITSRGVLSEADVDMALKEIRLALLEADVALPVVKDFIAQIKEQATGEKLVRSIAPAQLVIKIVHDELVKVLGDKSAELNLRAKPPVVIMIVGLQGSGKTTTAAKIAKRLKEKQKKKVLLASLDVYRPAAQEQLAELAQKVGVESLEIIKGQKPLEITKRALARAEQGFDVLLLDTAGRIELDQQMMTEVAQIKNLSNPTEVLLVADAMMGQSACEVAKAFNEKLQISGIVLTRIDGSSRAGAALSMKSTSGAAVKFLGIGEKVEDIEEFYPERLAGRILGQGDVVSLVEKTIEKVNAEDAEVLAKRMMSGKFDLNDMLNQLKQIQKLGSMSSIMGMLPGLSKFKDKIAEADNNGALIKKQEAIILSMTVKERKNPDIIKASRKQRIAKGSGVEVHEVNKLLKSYEQMLTMMKRMGKLGPQSAMLSQLTGNSPLGKMFGGANKFPF